MLRKSTILFTFLCLCFGLNGCLIKPYKVDAQQGNIIEKNALTKVKLGMAKNQVDALLGKPVLNDIFDEDRWIYVYTKEGSDGASSEQKVELHFIKDRLVEIKSK